MESLDWRCFQCVELLFAATGEYNAFEEAPMLHRWMKGEQNEFEKLVEDWYRKRTKRCQTFGEHLKCWRLFGGVHPDIITDQLAIPWEDWAWQLDYKEVLEANGEC